MNTKPLVCMMHNEAKINVLVHKMQLNVHVHITKIQNSNIQLCGVQILMDWTLIVAKHQSKVRDNSNKHKTVEIWCC